MIAAKEVTAATTTSYGAVYLVPPHSASRLLSIDRTSLRWLRRMQFCCLPSSAQKKFGESWARPCPMDCYDFTTCKNSTPISFSWARIGSYRYRDVFFSLDVVHVWLSNLVEMFVEMLLCRKVFGISTEFRTCTFQLLPKRSMNSLLMLYSSLQYTPYKFTLTHGSPHIITTRIYVYIYIYIYIYMYMYMYVVLRNW